MNTLSKIFDAWHREQTLDNPEIHKKWNEIMEYLYTNCSEKNKEDILTLLLDFSYLTEQQAYFAGFQQAFHLWLDSFKNDSI